MAGRLITLFAGVSTYSDDIAYGMGNAMGPGLLGGVLLEVGLWLARRR